MPAWQALRFGARIHGTWPRGPGVADGRGTTARDSRLEDVLALVLTLMAISRASVAPCEGTWARGAISTG